MPESQPKGRTRRSPLLRMLRRALLRPNQVRGISLVWYYQALRRWLTGRPDLHEARLIHRDPDLAIAWLPGRSSQAVLVFVSIQPGRFHPDHLQLRETVSDQGHSHILFILDRRISWYSVPGMRDRIARVVNSVLQREGIDDLRSIGISMGGFGAILFRDCLPIGRVVAFVPQILMRNEVIDRPNWAVYRPMITAGVERDLTPILAREDTDFRLVYGDRDEDDPIHLGHLRKMLPDARHVRIVIVPGQKHTVALWLKRQGQLRSVVSALWAGDRQALEACSRKLKKPLDLSLA